MSFPTAEPLPATGKINKTAMAFSKGFNHDSNYIEQVKKELKNKPADQLTAEEKLSLEHVEEHEKHQGHESMHAEMFVILIIVLIVVQVILVQWKHRHFQSYQQVTLFGMWAVPISVSIKNGFWRFIFFWMIFSIITGLIFRKSLQRPLHRTTPRLVYKWFYFLHKVTYLVGTVGYMIILFTMFGANVLFDISADTAMSAGMVCVFYSVYYGVIARDISEIASDKMASHIGYYTSEGIPTRHLSRNVCAVCGNRVLVDLNEVGVIENTYKLTCGHLFHEFCIRGWCIVGKKQTCPYCKEKVDLKKMFLNPWERPHILFANLLDWVRWLVVWQPCIFFIMSGINWALGLD